MMDEEASSNLNPGMAWNSAGHRAAKNTLMLIVLRLVVPLLSLALVFTLSRKLGADGLGRYTLVFGFLTLLGGLGPLGLQTVITRDGAGNPTRVTAVLRNAMTLCTGPALLLMLAMMAAGPLLDYDRQTRAGLLILSIALLPYTVGMLLDGAIVALERMQLMVAATLAEYGIKVGVAMVLLLLGYGLNAVLMSAVVGRILGCLVAAKLLQDAGIRVGWSLDRAMLARLSRLAPTFALTAVFATLYWRIDILMLSKLAPVADLGYYGAAYRLFELGSVVPQSLCLSIYPQVAVSMMSDHAQVGALGRNVMRYLLATSLAAAALVTVLAGPILTLLYGSKFDAAAPTLSLLIWTLLPYSVVRYHAYVLVAANRQNVDLLLNIVMSAVNIALNFVLIPRYSHFGAACATFLSLCMLALLQYGYLRRGFPGCAARLSIQPVVLTATALMGLCAWLLRDARIWAPLTVAPMLYFVVLMAGGFFTTAELRFLHIDRLLGRTGTPGARRP